MKRLTTMPLDDLELDQLLARNRLSGAQYDAIERRVLAQVAPKPKRRWWLALAPATALASALSVWLLLPSAPSVAPPDSGEFRAKSAGAPAPGALIDAGCGASTPHVCRLGDTLMFSVAPQADAGFLVAYAERVDDPSQPRIWYFPTAGGMSPTVERADTTRVLAQGIRLKQPHTAGRYRISAWISPTPIERSRAEREPQPAAREILLDIVE